MARGTCLARRLGRFAGGRSAGERRRKGLASPRGARRKDDTTRGEKRRFAHISTPCSAAAARTTRPRASHVTHALRGRRGSRSAQTRARTARSECKQKTRHDDEAVRRGHGKDCATSMDTPSLRPQPTERPSASAHRDRRRHRHRRHRRRRRLPPPPPAAAAAAAAAAAP